MSNLIRLDRATQLDVERARDLLAKCVHVDEAKGMRDQAQAAQVMAKKLKLGREAEQLAGEVALWAERRLGELLRDLPKHEGTKAKPGNKNASKNGGTKSEPPFSDAPKLADIGVSKKESARAQKLAAMPAKTVERRVAELKSERRPISSAKVLATPKPATSDEWNREDFKDRVRKSVRQWFVAWREHESSSGSLVSFIEATVSLEGKLDEKARRVG